MRASVCLILFSLLVLAASSQQAQQWGNLKSGPHKIGFRTMVAEDQSRNYGARARIIQVYIWYPAENPVGKTLAFGDYMSAASYDWGSDASNRNRLARMLNTDFRSGALNPSFPQPLSDEQYMNILKTPVPVYLNAKPVAQKFPVVLQIHANGALHQSVMLEYLASHGYVVASISMYGSAPVHYGRGEDGEIGQHVMVDDLAFVLSQIRRLPFADPSRTATIGMMAQAGIALFMKEETGNAIVCLDCYPDPVLMRELAYYDPRKVRIPIMQMLNSTFWDMNSFIRDSLPFSSRTMIEMKGLQHSDFYPFPKIAKPDSSLLYINYEKTATATRWFLDRVLYGKGEALADTALHITDIPAAGAMPTEAEFLGWLRYNQMDSARKYFPQYGSALARQQNFFGTVLFMARDQDKNAREAFDMFVRAYPDDKRREMIGRFLTK